jgi:RNA polymerase sigma-70 factor (ECF subfamily)
MLLEAARCGDEEAFRRLVEGHRAALHSHCYRMLGSLHDAEDAFQETMLRAWRGRAGFQGRSSVGTWLHRIATNVCIDAIGRRHKRVLPIDYGPPTGPHPEPRRERAEPVLNEPYSDQEVGTEDGATAPEARYERREAVELALIAAMQHLPARQRAVLILRDVLGFSAKEAAVILETTVASINSALQRARRAFDERLPERSQQATLRLLGDVRMRDLVERLVHAFERDDVGAILALLDEDATFAISPSREPVSRPRLDPRLVAHARGPRGPAARSDPRQRPTRARRLAARSTGWRLLADQPPCARPRPG